MSGPWKRCEVIGDATLYLGDCLEVLPTLGAVDALVTDPPYGIGAHNSIGGDNKAAVRRYVNSQWDSITQPKAIETAISIARRAIVFGGNYYALPPSKGWLVWDKHGTANFGACELAWSNIDMPIQKIDHMWMGFWRKGNEERGHHPTQKPLGVMQWCLGFLPDARTILDPFMGSGTTGVACVREGRKFIGVEIDEGYFDIACRRIEAETRAPRFDLPPPVKPTQVEML